MQVRMRFLIPGAAADPYGSGRNTFERERRAALLAGYRVVPAAELTEGERAQARAGSSGIAQPVVIELLAKSTYGVPAGTRYALGVDLDPGEE